MTFPTGVDFRKYSDEELTTMLAEAGEASKHARKRGRVMGIVAAHRLKQMRELLMYEELATWRRENGFDRVEAVEKNWFGDHRSLPPTPEQYHAGLWVEVNALRDAISMPLQVLQLINAIEQDKLSDEEYATLKRLMEKRVRETAQVTAVTQASTVQHCSPVSPNPDTPSDVCFNLENEGTMSQELEELTSSSAGTGLETPGQQGPPNEETLEQRQKSSAGTGLETPGQQGPPNEGTLEQRQTTANGFLTAGVNSSQKSTRTVTVADIPSIAATPSKRKHKSSSEENKQFDPGGRGEKAPPWNAAVPLSFFSCGEAGRLLVCLFGAKLGVFLSVFSALCVFSRTYIFPFTGETYQRSCGSWTRIRSLMHATGAKAFFSPTTLSEDDENKQCLVWS